MENRCPYCFKILAPGQTCDCKYEESANARIEDALHPGAVVGASYQIGAVLGRGGFGITYRAFDLDIKRIVAIKEFFPKGMVIRYGAFNTSAVSEGKSNVVKTINTESGNVFRKSLELFYREAEALGKLDKQPNVVHVHRIFRENGTVYIVMEFLEGGSLKSLIQERGRIPENELLPLLDPVLTALEAVHKGGLLHRDIAPDNIMIENGQPVLVDFGAVRVEGGHESSLVISKKGYSSFEQLAGAQMDQRSDIYAMGATFYTALSGIVPQDSSQRMMNDQVVPLCELNPEISRQTSDAVAKAMALKPENRWASAAEFSDALNHRLKEIEAIYQTALHLMEKETLEGYTEASQLLSRIPGWKNADSLLEECVQKTSQIGKKRNIPLVFLVCTVLTVIIGLIVILFRKPNVSEYQMQTQVALVQTQNAIKLAQTSLVETDAPVPVIMNTSTPGATLTNTPRPTLTNTPRPTMTNTPRPTMTNTPRPTLTNTPRPTLTNTPRPTMTNTPRPTLTNTPRPTITNTPRPTLTNTSRPTITYTPKPVQSEVPVGIINNDPDMIIDENGKLVEYNGTAETVVIPYGVTILGENAFYNREYPLSVTIPESVEIIEKYAFGGTRVRDLVIPNSVTSIEKYAFNSIYLKSISIPHSVVSIDKEAFWPNTKIKVKENSYAEKWCIENEWPNYYVESESLIYLDDPKMVIDSNGVLLQYTGNSSEVIIPDWVTAIDNYAFYRSEDLKKISIPDSVISIGMNAFHGCEKLEDLKIPDSVISIGRRAFFNCVSLESVSLSNNITTIEEGLFLNCPFTNITIPDSVTSIKKLAFSYLPNLTNVIIPDSVTYIGDSAFTDCESLASIIISSNVTSINNNAFANCSNLSSITIPAGVTSIGDSAFSGCSNLSSITIPDSVTSIGDSAFSGCSNLLSITIPDSVSSIGNCIVPSNTKIYIKHNSYEKNGNFSYVDVLGMVISSDGVLLEYKGNSEEIIIPDWVTSIYDFAFNGNRSLRKVTIPNNVVSVGKGSFQNCVNLESITLPDNILEISNEVFVNCVNLSEVIIPGSVTSIGDYAFLGCDSLLSVEIPDSVTTIGHAAFYHCKNLSGITIPAGVTSIGDSAFSGCKNLSSVEIPDSVTSIGDYAFFGCKNLSSVEIPDSVTTIGDSAFDFCDSLLSVEIPDSVTSIGPNPFSNGTKMLVKENSFAEKWCKENHSNYSIVTSSPNTNYDFSNLKEGDIITFGRYEQDNNTSNGPEPIEWRVLTVEIDRALLISENCLDQIPYHNVYNDVTWYSSNIRSWLNQLFYNEAFNSDEQNQIPSTLLKNNNNPKYDTPGGRDTTDKVFLLSVAEANEYFSTDISRSCGNKHDYDENCWWLRSPGLTSKDAAYVDESGKIHLSGYYVNDSSNMYRYRPHVRPAIWLIL